MSLEKEGVEQLLLWATKNGGESKGEPRVYLSCGFDNPGNEKTTVDQGITMK